jgi:hypothetical protein
MTLDECLEALDTELSRDLEDSERIPILQTRLWLTELKMYKTNEFPNTPSLNKMISNLGEAVDTRQAGKMLIDAQPTAYDVDKVVEQLGKKQNNKGFGGTIQEIFYDLGLENAIEIVKGGGIDA